MAEKCPYCDAENLKKDANFDKPHYACETWVGHDDRIHRGNECYETQLTAQTQEIEKLRAVAEEVVRARGNVCLMGPMAFSKAFQMAQAVLKGEE